MSIEIVYRSSHAEVSTFPMEEHKHALDIFLSMTDRQLFLYREEDRQSQIEGLRSLCSSEMFQAYSPIIWIEEVRPLIRGKEIVSSRISIHKEDNSHLY